MQYNLYALYVLTYFCTNIWHTICAYCPLGMEAVQGHAASSGGPLFFHFCGLFVSNAACICEVWKYTIYPAACTVQISLHAAEALFLCWHCLTYPAITPSYSWLEVMLSCFCCWFIWVPCLCARVQINKAGQTTVVPHFCCQSCQTFFFPLWLKWAKYSCKSLGAELLLLVWCELRSVNTVVKGCLFISCINENTMCERKQTGTETTETRVLVKNYPKY